MVCGNMDVEAVQESYLDDLYDNSEEKVTNTLSKGKSKILQLFPSRSARQF